MVDILEYRRIIELKNMEVQAMIRVIQQIDTG